MALSVGVPGRFGPSGGRRRSAWKACAREAGGRLSPSISHPPIRYRAPRRRSAAVAFRLLGPRRPHGISLSTFRAYAACSMRGARAAPRPCRAIARRTCAVSRPVVSCDASKAGPADPAGSGKIQRKVGGHARAVFGAAGRKEGRDRLVPGLGRYFGLDRLDVRCCFRLPHAVPLSLSPLSRNGRAQNLIDVV